MKIEDLIKKIIPPSEHAFREGFSNKELIDGLTLSTRNQVEEHLVEMMSISNVDLLVVETLGYMKSRRSLPMLYESLNKAGDPISRIIISASIFGINKDKALIDIAIESFNEISSAQSPYRQYTLIQSFYYLVKFGNGNINELIEKYKGDSDYLIAHNANNAIG